MTATLIHERDGQEYLFTEDKTSRLLTGTLTSSLYRLRDLENTHGCFFVFPELSCQKEGVFRLKFVLFEISGAIMRKRSTLISNAFSVFSIAEYPGVLESTDLSHCFADQGLRIRIKKAAGKKQKEDVALTLKQMRNLTFSNDSIRSDHSRSMLSDHSVSTIGSNTTASDEQIRATTARTGKLPSIRSLQLPSLTSPITDSVPFPMHDMRRRSNSARQYPEHPYRRRLSSIPYVIPEGYRHSTAQHARQEGNSPYLPTSSTRSSITIVQRASHAAPTRISDYQPDIINEHTPTTQPNSRFYPNN